MKKKRLMAHLNTLLDTRVGILAMLSDDYLDVIFHKGDSYFGRVIDDFEWIEPGLTEKHKKLYAERTDALVLANSFRTGLIQILVHTISEIMLSANENPLHDGVTLDVNTYPYILSDDERTMFRETIRQALVGDPTDPDKLIFDLEVRMIHVPYKDLTIQYIGENWDSVYLYDFIEWSNHRAVDLDGQEGLAVSTEMFIPTLFRDLPERKLLKTADGYTNPFNEAMRVWSLWIRLRYLHPKFMSIPNPQDGGDTIKK